jgi:hypothetical protein
MPRLEPVTMATLFSSPNGDMTLSLFAFRVHDAWRETRDKAGSFVGRKI